LSSSLVACFASHRLEVQLITAIDHSSQLAACCRRTQRCRYYILKLDVFYPTTYLAACSYGGYSSYTHTVILRTYVFTSKLAEGNSRFCEVALGIPKIPGNSHGFPGIPMDSREFPVVLGIQARRRSSREDSPKWGIEVHH